MVILWFITGPDRGFEHACPDGAIAPGARFGAVSGTAQMAKSIMEENGGSRQIVGCEPPGVRPDGPRAGQLTESGGSDNLLAVLKWLSNRPSGRASMKKNIHLYMKSLFAAAILLAAHMPPVFSGTGSGDGGETTRAAMLKSLRKEKLSRIEPYKPGKLERSAIYVQKKRLMEKIFMGGYFYGFRPRIGGLETGSGFGGGATYQNNKLIPGVHITSNLLISRHLYQNYDLALDFPSFLGFRTLYSQLYAGYFYSPQRNYYGLGPDSLESDRTNYLAEQFHVSGTIGNRWLPWLDTWISAGYLQTRLGSGTSSRYASIEDRFDDETAPGLDDEPDLYYLRPAIKLDTRDATGNPRAGSMILFETSFYEDRRLDQYSFTNFRLEVQKYFPFLRKYRCIAVRFLTAAVLIDKEKGRRVPFFMLPYLGGHDTLRGFREYRFTDENYILLNIEYRWRALPPVDMALFLDAGKIFPNLEEYNATDLKTSMGVGIRFASVESTFMRVDVAWSEWGWPRYFVKFEKVF
jgi:hypothetical protein